MGQQLRILLIEDSIEDAELILRTIQRGGYEVDYARVETEADMEAALSQHTWDLILCDYSLPSFNAPSALKTLQARDIDIPFIIISGTIGEETAVNSLKAGAHDFLVKGNLTRLIPAIERELKDVEVRRERKQRERELEAIASVSAALRKAQTLDQMLNYLLEETLSILHAQSGGIWLFDPNKEEIHLEVERNLGIEKPFTVKRGIGLVGIAVDKKEFVISHDIKNDPRVMQAVASSIPPDINGVYVPLMTSEQVMGVLMITFPAPREPGGVELRVLNALAEICGSTIQRMRLVEQMAEQLNRLDALRTIDIAITSSFDLRVTINIVLEKVVELLKVDAASILLVKPTSGRLEYAAGHGFHVRAIENATLRIGEGMAGQVALQRRTIYVGRIANSSDAVARVNLLKQEQFVSYVGVPLMTKGEVKGVLEIFSRSFLQPSSEWLGFLEALAGQAAIAIDNIRLFEELQRSNFELALAYDQTLEGWSRALDLRDKETEGHTQRVTETAVRLAQEMGISGRNLIQLQRGALLHDIGKMGVPDNILLKPGPLTDEEWVVMKKHPEFAYQLLASISYLQEALDIPYCHHEKWDGTGYPRGLRGTEIPLPARIFAVVDVWDALTNDRPYRSAWKKQEAIDYLRAQSGKHFDPEVVDFFLRKMI